MGWARPDGYRITDSSAELDRDAIHAWLSGSYWSFDIPREVLDRAIDGSLCFGILDPAGRQVGFCRVVSDMATFAWVCDVVVAEGHRDRGLGTWMMDVVASHPRLQGLRRWLLATRDAHDLYRKTGFDALTPEDVQRLMIRPSEASYGPGGSSATVRPGTPDI